MIASTQRIIGITGNIASGKSAVATYYKKLGYPVVDADQIARDVVLPRSPVLAAVIQLFGQKVLHDDGTLNRQTLSKIIFSDASQRKALETILHPAILAESLRIFAELKSQGHMLVFYEASLLVETGRNKDLSGLITVIASDDIRKNRLMARQSLTNAAAVKIMAAQLPQEQKAAAAQWVIVNDTTLENLEQQAAKVLSEILVLHQGAT